MADITATLAGQVTITGELTVPMGIVPRGEIEVTENGNYDVTNYETADVAVPQPSGSVTITENGEHDVTDYVTADVQVPQPSGSIEITENGTVDVTDFVQAVVDVEPQIEVKAGSVKGKGGQTLTITGVDHKPSFFAFQYQYLYHAYTAGRYYIVCGYYGDKSYVKASAAGLASNSEAQARTCNLGFSYSNGTITLTVSLSGFAFLNDNYDFIYA